MISMKPGTFAEIYCEREGLPPAELNALLFRRALYPHARLVAGLVRWLSHRHFFADDEFIEDVGHLRNLQDFSLALGSYVEHPSNWGMLRRTFRIRVSARRMLKIVRTVFVRSGPVTSPPAGRNTFEPFDDPREGPSGAPRGRDTPPAR